MRSIVLALLVWLGLGLSAGYSGNLPAGFVFLSDINPSILQDMRYATRNNFIGKKLRGYKAAECVLAKPVAKALSRVQSALTEDGMSLVVFDCYRPARAVKMMVEELRGRKKPNPEYYPRFTGAQLFSNGYVASRSGHSSGGSVDLGLAIKSDEGSEIVDMGTGFDFFDPRSHLGARGINKDQTRQRNRLQKLMRSHGFVGYRKEWWHFRFVDEPFRGRQFDFPIRHRGGDDQKEQ